MDRDMEKARKVCQCECNTYTKDCEHILNITAALQEAREEGPQRSIDWSVEYLKEKFEEGRKAGIEFCISALENHPDEAAMITSPKRTAIAIIRAAKERDNADR